MQNVELNLLPFIVEALGYNKTVYPDIDKLYQTKKSEFYQAARNHELYNHQIITEGGLLQEEYCKKALGILLCANSDEKIVESIFNIFRKGWTYAYLFVENHTEINLAEFMQRLIKKQGGLDKVSDDFINTNLFICLYLALCKGKKIKEDEFYKKTLKMLKFRLEHYEEECPYRLSLKTSSPELLEKIKRVKDEIYSKCGIIKDLNTLINALNTKLVLSGAVLSGKLIHGANTVFKPLSSLSCKLIHGANAVVKLLLSMSCSLIHGNIAKKKTKNRG